jgi:hypothetical protein
MDTDVKPGAAAPDAAAAAAAAAAKKVKKTDVPVAASGVAGLPRKVVEDYFEQEGKMQATDRLQVRGSGGVLLLLLLCCLVGCEIVCNCLRRPQVAVIAACIQPVNTFCNG